MIDYKSTSGSDSLIERVPSANLDGPISLTWLWEIIVRTKRLPDDLDPKVLFIVLRDRLRNPEREVRQHALRVLADLISVIEQNILDKHMELLLPDLIINLSHVAPAVRKGTIDVLRIYLKHTSHPNEVLRKLMTAVPEDSHLMQGLLMAVPYFSNYQISEDTLIFLLRQLFLGTAQDFLRETAICSLVRTRSKLGIDRFNNLIGSEKLKEHETQMTDSESELITRSPRKVHFGGEVVKMRTPESDSNQQSSDDNDIQTSVIIDRPTSIKITVSDNVAAIKTRHRSMIPVRITTGGSNPSTPRKKIKPRRLHKSAPELGRVHASKIPLPHNGKVPEKLKDSRKNKEQSEKVSKVRRHSRGEDQFSPVPVHDEIEVFHNLTRSPERTTEQVIDDNKIVTSTSELPEKNNTYVSFRVYKEDGKEESAQGSNSSPMDIIVHDLIHKEDTWTKSRALDDLIILLRKNTFDSDSVPTSQLLQALFLCEKQSRLQNRAQEALKLVITRISTQTLHELFHQLCNDVIKIRPPSGVCLSLLVMQRSSPRQFFDNLNVEPNTREAMLQAMIAAARTFPSSEIDLVKGIHLAFDAMKDNKRAVRQAALETLASLAQVAGNTMILEAINMSRNFDDSDNLLTVVRTR
ncbi:uncharacterized protein BDFB_008725 [Asbolus verrucosus]|uniref:TOG domain-containing protein n=1 Tax=Asbolus verrucosus TaxID=1661398 RepID=A0A482VN35_ASBVE|nr:uncharacterized protein BDFB_008725 [Asbolus verrucosus]